MRRFLIAAWLGFLFVAAPSGAQPHPAAKNQESDSTIWIDHVWAGTLVGFDAVSVGSIVYVAYYNAARELTVARVDVSNREVLRKKLKSVFAGWDAHNSVVLALDRTGQLHVSGNMHTAPLIYARTSRAHDVDSLTRLDRMVGVDEVSVTYPSFFAFPDGSLGFAYRSGRSGDGVELINRFDGKRWERVLSEPLFAPSPGGERVNAYHTGFIVGSDGRFHVAWVWRETRMAETNFNVLYARSPDLKHWEDSGDRQLTLPITPANAEIAALVPTHGGLMNNIRLGFDGKGAPVISYLQYDGRGYSQLYHARRGTMGWQRAAATDWTYRWEFSGPGTLVSEIRFGGVRIERGLLVEDVKHLKYGRLRIELDPTTLAGTVRPAPPRPADPADHAAKLPFRPSVRNVRHTTPDSVRGSIRWYTLGSDNNDRPRTCGSVNLPPDCRMSAPLELRVLSAGASRSAM